MPEKPPIHMSHDYIVVPPKQGIAFPIFCTEWDDIKTQIKSISTNFKFYYTAGTLLVGWALSLVASILVGAFPDLVDGSIISKFEAYVIAAATAVVGVLFYIVAYDTKNISAKKSEDVITKMELIEQRYDLSELDR